MVHLFVILESSSIIFFPWLETEFSRLSGGYPNIVFFNLVTYSKLIQSLLSTIVQTIIFSMKKLKIRNIECEVIIVFSYISSVAVFILSFFEIIFQRKVLVSSSSTTTTTTTFTRDTELVTRIDDNVIANPLQTSVVTVQSDNKDTIINDLIKQLNNANQTIIELQQKMDDSK